jgi:hypothetical protein
VRTQIFALLLSFTLAGPAFALGERYVHSSSLNLRVSAAADSEVVAKLPINTAVRIAGGEGPILEVVVAGPEFFKGLRGYVAVEFLGDKPLVFEEVRKQAEAAADPAEALSLWQRAWALNQGDAEAGDRLLKAYEAAGRAKAAKWWKKKVAKARKKWRSHTALTTSDLDLAYFDESVHGRASGLRKDVLGDGCTDVAACWVVWPGDAEDFRPQAMRCEKPSEEDAKSALASPAVQRWYAQLKEDGSVHPLEPRVSGGSRIDLDGDGVEEAVVDVAIPTYFAEGHDGIYGPPTCERSLRKRGSKWEPLTRTECSKLDVRSEVLRGAMRVRGTHGVVLHMSYDVIGATGATLWKWREGKRLKRLKECAGNG